MYDELDDEDDQRLEIGGLMLSEWFLITVGAMMIGIFVNVVWF